LIRYCHSVGLLSRLNTNGLLLDRRCAMGLKRAGLTQCCVSIDSGDPQTHDRLRGVPGAYAKAVEGIRHLREAGVLCQIHTYAWKGNVTAGLEKIVALGRRLKVLTVFIFFPVAAGQWHSAFNQVLSHQEREAVRALLRWKLVDVELPSPRARCGVSARWILAVTPEGDVTPCPPVPYVIGNVKTHSLEELWQPYCAHMRLDFRGRCPMNDVRSRELLKCHVESVARALAMARRTPARRSA